jgi:hypothetical protein
MLVCGCDGITYSDPCTAYSSAVGIAYPGQCVTPDAGVAVPL